MYSNSSKKHVPAFNMAVRADEFHEAAMLSMSGLSST